LDTSVFIAQEQARVIAGPLPTEVAISVVTLGELQRGVLMAVDEDTRRVRLKTFALARESGALPVTEAVAMAYAELVSALRRAGRRAKVNDCWIAATAIVEGVPVCTQDDDFDVMPDVMPEVTVVRV
jgi:predicted nucleic acid-binding protein